ncbi:MAG: OsmC family protein [Deltaproteobacteria bacterium]
MPHVSVLFKGGLRFEVAARQHTLTVDLSAAKGGTDAGPTPPEIFAASLGTCVGVYVARYCANARLDATDMAITVSMGASQDQKSLENIDIVIKLPHADAGKRSSALLEVARHCLIHKTIERHPEIRISLDKG